MSPRPGTARRSRPASRACPAGSVLRLAGAQPAASLHPGQPARRPVQRQADRHHRPGGAPGAELPDRHHRAHRRPALDGTRRRAGRHHPGHPRRRRGGRLQLDRPPVHPRRGGTGAALPAARLHRHRDPAVGGSPRAAVRRPAPDRGDAPPGLGDSSRGGIRRRARRGGRWLRLVHRVPPDSGVRSVLHRHAVRARRPVAPAGRHPGRRRRRSGRGGGGRARRAAARADLPARGQPAGHAAGAPWRTG